MRRTNVYFIGEKWDIGGPTSDRYTSVCLLCSEKRVGNVYAKTKSFVEYVRRALRKLELDESKVGINILQSSFKTLPQKLQRTSRAVTERLVYLAPMDGK